MREANFAFPSQNRACVCITSALYDRRALDTTAALPLLNSLTHLTYLTSTSPRIREILTLDGGLERLLHILRNSSIPRPPPPPPDLYGLSVHPAIPASTGLLSPDRAVAYRFSLAFQCVSNVGVRGSEQIRTRVVQAGVLDVVAQVLEVWLRSRGMSTEAGPSGSGQPLNIAGRGEASSRSRRPAGAAPVAAQAVAASTLAPDGSFVVLRSGQGGLPYEPPAAAPRTGLPPSAVGEASGAIAPPPPFPAYQPPPQAAGPSVVDRGFAVTNPLQPPLAADSSRPSPVTSEARGGGSFPNSGDETSIHSAGEVEMGDAEDVARDAAALAASDEETARLAQTASSLLQSMASNTTFVSSRNGIAPEATPRSGPQALSVASAAPARSPSSSHRPSPIRSNSTSTTGTDSEVAIPTAIPVQLRQIDSLARPSLTGNASEASSAGGSNVSTPMGTPTGGGLRERSGTLLARPATVTQPPTRRRRRERTLTPGNDSTTTGGEDDGGDMMDGEEDDGGVAPGAQTEGAGAAGAMTTSNSQEVNIVQEETGDTDIEPTMDETIEGNMDLQMGAPPGAPGAANTPRAAPDMTPRQAFLPMTAAVPAVTNIGPSVTSPVAQAPADPAPAAHTPGQIRTLNMAGMTAPAVAALATAQATQRTLRDLSLEGNTMSPSETTYRDDDILLSLQLLAYLSKYPHVRQAFHKPRQPFHPNLELDDLANSAPLPMRPALSDTPNIFSLVERFTFRPSPSDPTTPQLPDEIVYWAGVIMRNACRKDESRGGIRQCANMSCGRWETSPRQFAKCRRCRKAKYCSKECQSKAWSEGHRFWCSQRGETDVPSTTDYNAAAAPGTLGTLAVGGGTDVARTATAAAAAVPDVPAEATANRRFAQPPSRPAHPAPGGARPSRTAGPSQPRGTADADVSRARPPAEGVVLPLNARAPSVDHTMDVDSPSSSLTTDPRAQPVPPTPRPAPVVRGPWAAITDMAAASALGNPEDVHGVPLLAPGSASFRPHVPPARAATAPSSSFSSAGHASPSAGGSGGGQQQQQQQQQQGSAFARLQNVLPRLYNFGHGTSHDAHVGAQEASTGRSTGSGEHSPARRSLFRALSSNAPPSTAQPQASERSSRPTTATRRADAGGERAPRPMAFYGPPRDGDTEMHG